MNLPALQQVTGPSERGNGLLIRGGGTLAQVDLPALVSVIGHVDMRQPSTLTSLSWVRGQLNVRAAMSAPSLVEVRGLHSWVALFAPLSADSLTSIGSGLEIHTGAGAVFFPALTSADYILSAKADFPSLDLPALTTLPGVTSRRWAGRIHITNSTATRISMPALESIADDFEIWLNSLTSIDFSSLTSVGSYFSVNRNPALPNCYATDILAQLQAAGWSGTAFIYKNDDSGTCP
jgi:hypothetical protein